MELQGKLSKIFFALSNPNRVKIYDLCLKKQRLNITQLSEEIKQSYKSILNNLRILEEAGLISREKIATEKSQETFISSIPLNKESVYYKVYQSIKEEEAEK